MFYEVFDHQADASLVSVFECVVDRGSSLHVFLPNSVSIEDFSEIVFASKFTKDVERSVSLAVCKVHQFLGLELIFVHIKLFINEVMLVN